MGIFIYCDIAPKRVTKEEWSRIYYETEEIIDAFPFMDKKTKVRNGHEYGCAVRTVGRKQKGIRNGRGWECIGDLITMRTAEEHCLYEDLDEYLPQKNNRYLPREDKEDDGLDLLLSAVRAYCNAECPEPSASKTIFCSKTQGEPYHVPLLAVACLIESRMPEGAAIVYGDINLAQCRKAVEWANDFLEEPISLPVICDRERLLKRLEKSGIARADIPEAVISLTLQGKGTELGRLLSQYYPEETYAYYRGVFKENDPDTWRFSGCFEQYLEMGLNFKELAGMLVTDPDGRMMEPLDFVKMVVKSKLYVEDKETYDYTDMDTDRPDKGSVDGISSIVSRVMLRLIGLHNNNVAAYLPLDEIQSACREVFGGRANVDALFEEAMDEAGKKEDISQNFYDNKLGAMAEAFSKKQEDEENYDICRMDDLGKWQEGCTVRPVIEENLKNLCIELHSFANEGWKDFAYKNRVGRENDFIRRWRTHVWLKESDWDWIFEHIMDDHEIRRAFALFCVDTRQQDGYEIVRRLWLYPDLYKYYWDLTEGTTGE